MPKPQVWNRLMPCTGICQRYKITNTGFKGPRYGNGVMRCTPCETFLIPPKESWINGRPLLPMLPSAAQAGSAQRKIQAPVQCAPGKRIMARNDAKPCRECGKMFLPQFANSTLCSPECKHATSNRRSRASRLRDCPDGHKICIICGRGFDGPRTRLVCGFECYKERNRRYMKMDKEAAK